MTPRNKTRLKIWAVLILVFALGGITGAVLESTYRLHLGMGRFGMRGGRGEPPFERLRRDLNLNDQQAAQVRAILDETRNEFHQLHSEARPRYDELRRQANERIRAVLTPEQRQRFDERVAEHDRRRETTDNSAPDARP